MQGCKPSSKATECDEKTLSNSGESQGSHKKWEQSCDLPLALLLYSLLRNRAKQQLVKALPVSHTLQHNESAVNPSLKVAQSGEKSEKVSLLFPPTQFQCFTGSRVY